MEIIINISNSKAFGLEEVRRRITVRQHIKNYELTTFTVPYTIEHLDANSIKIDLIPDISSHLIADNVKRVWVRANGTLAREPEPNTTEMGMYDYFEMLQKNASDTAIITGQILLLDSQNFFDQQNP